MIAPVIKRSPSVAPIVLKPVFLSSLCTFSIIETRLFTKRKQETGSRYTKNANRYSTSLWHISDKLEYSILSYLTKKTGDILSQNPTGASHKKSTQDLSTGLF